MAHTVYGKEKLLARVSRIEGQIKAIRKALEEETDCSEILQIVASSRGALNGLMSELIEGHVRDHVLDPKKRPTEEQSRAADQLLGVIKAYLK